MRQKGFVTSLKEKDLLMSAKILRSINKFVEVMPEITASIAGILLVALVIVIFINIMARNLFGWSFEFANEIAGFCLLGIVFLGLAYALKKGAHIKVELVTSFLPEFFKALLLTVAYGFGLVIVMIFFLGTLDFVNNAYKLGLRESTEFATPYFIPGILMPTGLFVFMIRIIIEGYRSLKNFLKLLLGS